MLLLCIQRFEPPISHVNVNVDVNLYSA